MSRRQTRLGHVRPELVARASWAQTGRSLHRVRGTVYGKRYNAGCTPASERRRTCLPLGIHVVTILRILYLYLLYFTTSVGN